MPKQLLPYRDTGYFSKLMCDYLAKEETTIPFYNRFPSLESFEEQLEEKRASFSQESRATLVAQLKKQYGSLAVSESTEANIEAFGNDNTFTITTGHQLNLFTGPLYFLYKIVSAINLSEQLKEAHPKDHFVPVYWMATEDHDFDEINYFNLNGKKVAWERESGGAVGELSTEGLEDVREVLQNALGSSKNAKELVTLFTEGYEKHSNLADATRYIANELFKEYGLVIIDGNDPELKKAFIPYAEKELFENRSYKKVTETTSRLVTAGYKEQVHPREINLFYIKQGIRERIVAQEGQFYVNDTDISFTSDGINEELKNHPERFSPNALLRPLFQEAILPNLCYIGGGGEMAYWFQLKDYFESVEVPFPILLLRNSVVLVPQRLSDKLMKLEVDISRLFQKQEKLKTEYAHQLSEIKIDFSEQRDHLQKQFENLYTLAEQTDASFLGAVGAQEKKQLKGLDRLEKRLLKAQKRKLADRLERLTMIQDQLFPKQSLQERTMNFSEFYLEYGYGLISELKKELDPLAHEFTILYL
ncbi:bacillithiol biosynthesis cysteine-adding enzyme BshC [Aureisphaera galaxeae]|uniref:bacillithiol biosynthesis cysteine-adding enzyme BshC n=1 Tax=Aureisphaera galaxeae TaxID=1538023 RepID=UPI0023500C50|nr:bacillithiol biosynthesis cysteine-adding enzyme BshC [Aureisphaera galaxeae]MDC8003381.1 bacillithiol biosynthesis cysteine-adding enzyme BshC [Aureisphaera galaxeae]